MTRRSSAVVSKLAAISAFRVVFSPVTTLMESDPAPSRHPLLQRRRSLSVALPLFHFHHSSSFPSFVPVSSRIPQLCKESGKASQEKKKNHIKGLVIVATDHGPQYASGKLQIGISDQTLIAALGQAAIYTEEHSKPPAHIKSPVEEGHWPFPREKLMQGYAYILTHPGTDLNIGIALWLAAGGDGWVSAANIDDNDDENPARVKYKSIQCKDSSCWFWR